MQSTQIPRLAIFDVYLAIIAMEPGLHPEWREVEESCFTRYEGVIMACNDKREINNQLHV